MLPGKHHKLNGSFSSSGRDLAPKQPWFGSSEKLINRDTGRRRKPGDIFLDQDGQRRRFPPKLRR